MISAQMGQVHLDESHAPRLQNCHFGSVSYHGKAVWNKKKNIKTGALELWMKQLSLNPVNGQRQTLKEKKSHMIIVIFFNLISEYSGDSEAWTSSIPLPVDVHPPWSGFMVLLFDIVDLFMHSFLRPGMEPRISDNCIVLNYFKKIRTKLSL